MTTIRDAEAAPAAARIIDAFSNEARESPGKARRNPRKCENNLNNFPNIFARARATLFSWMIMSQCAGK